MKKETQQHQNIENYSTDNIVKADFTPPKPKHPKLIKTIGYDQKEMIADILTLHCPSGIELDCTYSTGNFYKNAPYSEPKYKSDTVPIFDDVMEANAKDLPFYDDFLKSIMFDPPFLAGKPKPEHIGKMRKRFSWFPSMKELWEFYKDTLKEFYRVLEPGGVLIFKCQDLTESRQLLSHVYIVNEAEKMGFYVKDLFVLLAKTRLVSASQRSQKHARKFHSYFLVFEKKNKACAPIHI